MIADSTFGIYWNQSFVSLNKTVPKLRFTEFWTQIFFEGVYTDTVKHGYREHTLKYNEFKLIKVSLESYK